MKNLAPLLPVADARAELVGSLQPVGVEHVALADSAGRVLAAPISSGVDLPPFTNSSMDGFAVRAEDIGMASESAPAVLIVVGDVPAGQVSRRRLRAQEAMRIMTGAPLPEGADTVVPVEDTDFGVRDAGAPLPSEVRIRRAVSAGAYVRKAGEDLRADQRILEQGHLLKSQDLAMLATLGIASVPVHRRPRVAVLSTGDELLEVDEPLAPGKIRESNSYALAVQVESCGADALRMGIVRDRWQDVEERLDQAKDAGADLIVSSAGVSVGAYDYVRDVVESRGRLNFWRVNMRPGKPLAFGAYRDVPFIGLPGNPVSSFVGFEVFIRPGLHKLAGRIGWRREVRRGTLLEDVESDGRESYLRGVVELQDGRYGVRLAGHQGSGNLFSLVLANALFIIPAGVRKLNAGAEIEYWPI